MLLYPILALIFASMIIYRLTQTPIEWDNIAIQTSLTVGMIAMWLWLRHNFRKRIETYEWLDANKHNITDAPQYFRDSPFPLKPISKQTNLRDFRVVTSCLVITTMHNIGSDLRGSPLRGILATFWTLLFGWWGFPWGPIRTIQALITNLSGGEKTSVAEAILNPEEEQ